MAKHRTTPASQSTRNSLVDGPRSAAQIKGIGPDWACTFQGTDREFELAIRDLVLWGAIHDTTSGSLALLADGGQLACQLRKGDRERVQLDSDLLGDVDLPISQLTGLLLKTPSVPSQRDRLLARLREISGEKDWLLLENGDELSGTIASINHESLVLASDVGESRIELPKVVAIVFNPAYCDAKPNRSRSRDSRLRRRKSNRGCRCYEPNDRSMPIYHGR